MSLELLDKKYCVYKHTVPNGKVYIGITGDVPEKRWMSGFGYKTQIYFFRAIVKYGWVNIKHEILYDNLSKEEAETKEIELIDKYKSSDHNFGYNIDLGGCYHLTYVENREKLSAKKLSVIQKEKERIQSLKIVNKITGHIVYKYDSNGKFLATFNTCKEAAIDAGVPYSTFQRWVRGHYPKNAEYVYSYGKFNEGKYSTYKQTFNAKPIDMFDLALKYIKTFASLTDAGKYIESITGSKWSSAKNNIHSVCNGHRLIAYNYIWRYHNENTNNKIA